MQIELSHNGQGWIVEGGGLPRGTAWSVCDTYAEARREADELAADLCLEVVETRSATHALLMDR